MRWIDNLGIKSKFLLVPTLAVAGIIFLSLVFTEVYLEQKRSIDEVSQEYVQKEATINDLFSSLTKHHTRIMSLLIDVNHGMSGSKIYDKGIKELDRLRLLQNSFAQFSTSNALSAEEKTQFDALRSHVDSYVAAVTTSVEMATVDINNAVDSLARTNEFYAELFTAHNEYSDLLRHNANAKFTRLETLTLERYKLVIASSAVLIVLIVALSLLFTKSVRLSLKEVERQVNIMASGDFSTPVTSQRRDEVGKILTAIGTCVEQNRRIINEMAGASRELERSSTEVANLIGRTAEHSATQSHESSGIIEKFGALLHSIGEVADHAVDSANASSDADRLVGQGKEVVIRNLGSTRKLANEVESISATLKQLSEDSKNISNVVNTVREIAEQTNLLALNAAIEAARAGEQGRGFAVVADEVRDLSLRTQNATKEIDDMVVALQAGVVQSVKLMGSGREMAVANVTEAESAGAILDEIAGVVAMIANKNRDVAAFATRQRDEVEGVNTRLREIGNLAMQSNEQAKGTLEHTAELQSLGKQLKAVVNRFHT